MSNEQITVKYRYSKLMIEHIRSLFVISFFSVTFFIHPPIYLLCLSILIVLVFLFILFQNIFYTVRSVGINCDQFTVRTLSGQEFVFDIQAIYSIGKNKLTFSHYHQMIRVSFPYALNQTEILHLLLNARGVKNIDETMEFFLRPDIDFTLFFKEEHSKAYTEATDKSMKVLNKVFYGIMFAVLAYLIYAFVVNHWSVILIVGFLLCIGLCVALFTFFDRKIESIRNIILKTCFNFLLFIAGVLVSVIISMGLYQLFLAFGIDLLTVHL